ncbi:MAG: DUF1553 domain-containing protein [Fuerstiella sp.]
MSKPIGRSVRGLFVVLLVSSTGWLAFADDSVPLRQRIDDQIAALADGPLSPKSTDATFVRRVYLDFAGRIPTVDETRGFLQEADLQKRERLIQQLLDSPACARRLRDVFHVMLMERLGDHPEWSQFLERSFAENKAWDQLVREILHPDADDEATRGAAFFWTKRLEKYGQNPVDYPGLTRDVGRLFLGVDMQCAESHDHLFIDDYRQADFQGLSAFVKHTFIRTDAKFPAVGEKLVTDEVEFASVFVQQPMTTGPRLPGEPPVSIVRFEKGEEYLMPPDRKTKFPGVPRFSPLSILAEQLPRRDNSAFSRNSVNRFWFVLFGRGLVEPLDLHHSDNPPSHPELLALMAEQFVAHEFDIRWLLKEMALSEAYQRSSRLPSEDAVAPATYRTALERPLSAEQLLASIVIATGQTELAQVACGTEVDDKVRQRYSEQLDRFRATFANVKRDPETDFRPSVKAALFLMNDDQTLRWFEPHDASTAAQLATLPEDTVADELYLRILSRPASETERARVAELFSEHPGNRAAVLGHLVWALTASAEFCLNH